MAINEQLKTYLTTRRSVTKPFLAEPGPSGPELIEMLTLASRVPDHGKLGRWRFMVFEGDARERAGEMLAEIAARKTPTLDEAGLQVERSQFLPAPLTVGIISTAAPHEKIPEFEQLLSAGNVALNLVHTAAAFGYGAHWVTRWFAYDDEAARRLGAGPNERFVGFVHIGTPTATLDERERPDIATRVRYWSN